jgi:hypothetical protein
MRVWFYHRLLRLAARLDRFASERLGIPTINDTLRTQARWMYHQTAMISELTGICCEQREVIDAWGLRGAELPKAPN